MSTLHSPETNDGVVTSWIPLTTVYTPPPSCASIFRISSYRLLAYDPGYGLEVNSAVACQPHAVTTWWAQGLLGGVSQSDRTVASILPLTCPDAWPTVVTSVKDQSSTLAMCCPSGYYLTNGRSGPITGDCMSNVFSGMTLTYASGPSGQTTKWSILTTTLSSRSTVGAIAVMGWNVNVATPTTTPTSAASTTPSHISDSLPTATVTSSSSLSPGAKAGIGVGVSLGTIGLVALLAAIFLLRRKKPIPPPDNQGNTDTAKASPPSNLGYQAYRPGYVVPPEMEGGHGLSELEEIR